MRALQINHVSHIALAVLSLAAVVLIGIGYTQLPLDDEGLLAHSFQLTILALSLTGLVFLVTADWTYPMRILRQLVLPAIFVAIALSGLYHLEHAYYPAHYGWHVNARPR